LKKISEIEIKNTAVFYTKFEKKNVWRFFCKNASLLCKKII